MRPLQLLPALLVMLPAISGGRQTIVDKEYIYHFAGPSLALLCSIRGLDQARPIITEIQGRPWLSTQIVFVFANEGSNSDIEAYAPKGRLWRSHNTLKRVAARFGMHPAWAPLP